jgi:hypothetical protein
LLVNSVGKKRADFLPDKLFTEEFGL